MSETEKRKPPRLMNEKEYAMHCAEICRRYHQNHKEERNAQCRKWKSEHKEHIKAYNKAYHEEYKEALSVKRKLAYAANREKEIAQVKAYYQEHRDEINERRRAWRATYRDLALEKEREYKDKKPGYRAKLAEKARIYRAKLKTEDPERYKQMLEKNNERRRERYARAQSQKRV